MTILICHPLKSDILLSYAIKPGLKMKPHEEIFLIVGLALLWFAAILFSMGALIPSWAFAASLLAVAIVTLTYKILDATDNLTVGLVVTLVFIPLICIAAGIVWWGMRLLGFLELN